MSRRKRKYGIIWYNLESGKYECEIRRGVLRHSDSGRQHGSGKGGKSGKNQLLRMMIKTGEAADAMGGSSISVEELNRIC